MRVLDTIASRRSLRGGFTTTPVAPQVVDEIVEAGRLAPSSKNAQPWRIHVVTDRELTARLARAVRQAKGVEDYVPCDPATGEPRPDWPSTVVESAFVLESAPLCLFIENRGEFSTGRGTLAALEDPEIRADALIGYSFECIGLGAAIQSMWLIAVHHGLGGAFMGDVLIAEDAIRAALSMSGDLAGVLCLGQTVAPARRPRTLHPDRVVRHDADPQPAPARR